MPLVPHNIHDLQPYKAGKPIEEVRRELGLDHIIKLASNENPLGPPPGAIAAATEALKGAHRYPDPSGFELRSALAKKFNLKIDNVILGAGSEGIMSTIMRTFLLDDDEIISASGSFIGFKVLANASGNRVHWVPMQDNRYDLESMAQKINDYTKIVYIANPDNPMGTYITRKEFDGFYAHVPERVLIILDEAYYEYAQNTPDYPDSMTYRYDNVITLRTFSKIYGMGGIRCGYGFAHETLITNLMKVKLPFEVSVPAHAAALAALDDTVYVEKSIRNNAEGMQRFEEAFAARHMPFIKSVTNFMTLLFPDEAAAAAFTRALLEKGVIVRHLVAFGVPHAVRITIGSPEENDFFLEQLATLDPATWR